MIMIVEKKFIKLCYKVQEDVKKLIKKKSGACKNFGDWSMRAFCFDSKFNLNMSMREQLEGRLKALS